MTRAGPAFFIALVVVHFAVLSFATLAMLDGAKAMFVAMGLSHGWAVVGAVSSWLFTAIWLAGFSASVTREARP